jgi:UDP-3-O-[3-hydroxymyristoyl] glucosamine N-acyltransferase LpxD
VPAPGIDPSASVDPSAQVDASAHVGPQVTIEAGAVIKAGAVIDAGCFIGREAVIGEGTHLFANATFHARCSIGARGIIHSGAVIGTDGFGFANEGGVYIKIPQTGRVVIGDDVDIGANTCIDRGALADTIIEDGVKLDNQIQIGHNCHIGAHTAMAGCVGVAGSAKIGKHCTFGGAAMVLGHLTIADNVHISSGSMVSRSMLEAGPVHRFLSAGEKRRVGKKRGHRAQSGEHARKDPRAGKNNQNADRTKMTTTENKTLDICQIKELPAAPLSAAAGRPRADLGSGKTHHRDQERDRQRRILQRPLPAQAGDAGRADDRGDGADRRHPVLPDHGREAGREFGGLLRRHRQRALQAPGRPWRPAEDGRRDPARLARHLEVQGGRPASTARLRSKRN